MPYVPLFLSRLPLVSTYVKRSLFEYFCGGEDSDACIKVIEQLRAQGLYGVLDYAAEGAQTEAEFNAHVEEIRKCLRVSQQKNVAFSVLKPSALGDTNIMAKKAAGKRLNEADLQALQSFTERLHTLAKEAHQLHVPLLVDAEEYAFQSYVDEQVMQVAAQYNKKWVCVYNTFQLYLKDGYERLTKQYEASKKAGHLLGIKLVRGAYMEKERKIAQKAEHADPIQDSKADCDKAYHRAIDYCLDNIDGCALFMGTHNEASCLYLQKGVQKRAIAPEDARIWISQLYGMSDNISYGMAQAGFRVAKYIPYGPYKQLLPYLYRRAMENSASQDQSDQEQYAISRELRRRKQKDTHF